MQVDLNCDVGEIPGPSPPNLDAEIMEFATSVSIACGFHAGDPGTMRRTVAAAVARGVAIGAHPGYPDRAGFGRHELQMSPGEIGDAVIYQVAALDGFVRGAGARLQHVKLHGALYNLAARSDAVAEVAVAATATLGKELIVVGPPGSALETAAARHGLPFAAEVFADRTYAADGRLTARDQPDAFVHDPLRAARRALLMLREGMVDTTAGTRLPVRADTICVHGDNPAAVAFARRLAQALDDGGVTRRALGAMLKPAR